MTTIDEYIEIEKRIDAREQESLRDRWEFGKRMLAERVAGGRGRGEMTLPVGRLNEIAAATGQHSRELSRRMQFAEMFPTEDEFRHACLNSPTWRQLIKSMTKPRERKPAPPAPKADDQRLTDAINRMEDAGNEYSAQDVVDVVASQGLSISPDTVERKRKAVRAERDAEADAMNIDWDSVPATAKQKLEAMRRRMIKEYDREFEPRVQAAVQVRLAEAQTYMDKLYNQYRAVLSIRKGIFTRAEHDLIRACLHPDSRLSMSDDRLATAFRVFNEKDILLLNEADRPTTTFPASLGDLLKRRKNS